MKLVKDVRNGWRLSMRAHFGAAAMLGVVSAVGAQTRPPVGPPPPVVADVKTPAQPVAKEPARQLAPRNQAVLPRAPKPELQVDVNIIDQALETKVFIDQPGDGLIWARGLTYKASFGTQGFTYIPFLGSDAPGHEPVQFTIDRVTVNGAPLAFDASVQPTVAATRISFNRGPFVEVYDLTPTGIEQSFIMNQRLNGELAFHVQNVTDMAATQRESAIEFVGNRGSVGYSQAIAVDARAVRTPLETKVSGSGITIKVPSETVTSAAWPLVVDPVITTIGVESGTSFARSADVAYEPTLNRYNVTYEQEFTATDHDVWTVLYNADGSLVGGSLDTIDFTTTTWTNPRTASKNTGDLFLTVAARGVAPSRTIWGRTRAAGSNVMSAQVQISAVGAFGDQHSPDVGGDPFNGAGTFWLVVWQRVFSATDEDVHAQLVDGAAALFGATIHIDNSGGTLDRRPAVSNSCGGTGLWMVAWDREFSATDRDIRGAVLDFDGTVTVPSFSLDFSGSDNTNAAVSSLDSAGNFLVAYNEGPSQIYARYMDGSTIITGNNLTVVGGDPTGEAQQMPFVDTDGAKFMVTYGEQYFGTDWDSYIQSFCINGTNISRAEGRRNLTFTIDSERLTNIASTFGGGDSGRQGMAVWNSGNLAGGDDVGAVLFTNPLACCPADVAPFGGNGLVNVDDLLVVINQWNPAVCLDCEGDIDGDLAVIVNDLLAVINGWGPCP